MNIDKNTKDNAVNAAKKAAAKGGPMKKRIILIALAVLLAVAAPLITKYTGKNIDTDTLLNTAESIIYADKGSSVPAATDADDTAENQGASDSKETEQNTEKSTQKTTTQAPTANTVKEDGRYTAKDDVALYIHLYGHLPDNFITKKQAQTLGWNGGSLEPYSPGSSIGGDHFSNYEGLLPKGNYTECDIDTMGKSSRGAKRIVFSDSGAIYYTDDHYESFTQLY